MACNTGYAADEEALQEHLQAQQCLTFVPSLRSDVHPSRSKKRRTDSSLTFDNPDPSPVSPVSPVGLTVGSETKRLLFLLAAVAAQL